MCVVFFFKQKTAYEMRISDWSSDVCSSDLPSTRAAPPASTPARCTRSTAAPPPSVPRYARTRTRATCSTACKASTPSDWTCRGACPHPHSQPDGVTTMSFRLLLPLLLGSEEHTSELQSLMRNSYAVLCL